MENSESYLNLNSDQFNSWLSEFETQFSKLEKKNLTSSHSQESCEEIDNDSICNSVEIECSSESEDCDSNIFIKDSSSGKNSNINSTISSNKCLFRYGRPLISSERNSDRKKKSEKCSKKRISKSSTEDLKKISKSDSPVKSENKPNICEPKQSILTIQQINSIIPDFGHKNKRSKKVSKKKNDHLKINEESNCHENIVVKKNIKLGSQALYRFIAKRSR